jgi:NMD protein affecting ribosome stability and mRNA decay
MRRKRSSEHTAARTPRPARRVSDPSPGARAGKLADLAACPGCGASYRKGRWTWQKAPAGSYEKQCPACERIEKHYPAGVLNVDGAFVAKHRQDVVGTLRHVEERERTKHPLKRIMGITKAGKGLVVETTDGKLAQSLGRALHKAFSGRLEPSATTADKENLVRVRWTRD